MDQRLLFVIIGNAPYRSQILTSKQMVTAQLARKHPVLYVEPPPLTLDPLVKPAERGRYLDYRRGVQTAAADEPMVVCPPPFRQALDTRWPFLDDFNQGLLGRFIKRTIGKFSYDQLVLISFVYNAARIADIVAPDLFVYYCIDLFSELRIPYSKSTAIEKIEKDTICAADLIFAISRKLEQRLKKEQEHVYYAPHGVQYELFSRAAEPGPLPADLARLARPRIGFVGVLAHWLNYELLIAMARRQRQWNFCFVGPVGPHVDPALLAAEPNIHLFGERPREQVVDYLRGFDACLVPFKINDLTLNSSPLKAYEYMAAGRPVISTPLPEVARFAPPVVLAEDAEGFIHALKNILSHWSDKDRQASMSLAAELSWEKRVQEILNIINLFLDR